MTVVLPRDANGIDSLVPALTGARWSVWTTALDAAGGGMSHDLYLPKFVLTYGPSMKSVLSALGMPDDMSSVR